MALGAAVALETVWHRTTKLVLQTGWHQPQSTGLHLVLGLLSKRKESTLETGQILQEYGSRAGMNLALGPVGC